MKYVKEINENGKAAFFKVYEDNTYCIFVKGGWDDRDDSVLFQWFSNRYRNTQTILTKKELIEEIILENI